MAGEGTRTLGSFAGISIPGCAMVALTVHALTHEHVGAMAADAARRGYTVRTGATTEVVAQYVEIDIDGRHDITAFAMGTRDDFDSFINEKLANLKYIDVLSEGVAS